MQAAKNVNAMDVVRLAARLPDTKDLPGLKNKFNAFAEEIASGVTEERLSAICGEIGRIKETEDVIHSVGPMLSNPNFVANVCRSIVSYWDTVSAPQKIEPEKETHPGALKRNLTDDERDVFDLINQT